MEVILKKETIPGATWVLVSFGNDWFAFGLEEDKASCLGFPVEQYGSKETLCQRLNAKAEKCKQLVAQYQNMYDKQPKREWQLMAMHNRKEFQLFKAFEEALVKYEEGERL